MKQVLVVLSIVLFASMAFANTVEIRLDGVEAAGTHINAFSLNFYPAGSDDLFGGTYQYPEDVPNFSFSWANPPQVTRVVWTLDNYPYMEAGGDYFATAYAAYGPNTEAGALNDGLVITLQSGANFGINASDPANYIHLAGEGTTNAIGTVLQVNEQWWNATEQTITISLAVAPSCVWDIEPDGGDNDVDGLDLHDAIATLTSSNLATFASEFGVADCASLSAEATSALGITNVEAQDSTLKTKSSKNNKKK